MAQREEPYSPTTGSLRTATGTLPLGEVLKGTISKIKSQTLLTTENQSPGKMLIAGTGRELTEMMSAVSLAAKNNQEADKTDKALRQSLRLMLGPRVGFEGEPLPDDGYGYDEIETIKCADADSVLAALSVVEAACEPAIADLILVEILRLRVKTKQAAHGETDAEFQAVAYVEELSEYPLDVVRTACRLAARKSVFFPAISELRTQCGRAYRQRKRWLNDLMIVSALERPGESL